MPEFFVMRSTRLDCETNLIDDGEDHSVIRIPIPGVTDDVALYFPDAFERTWIHVKDPAKTDATRPDDQRQFIVTLTGAKAGIDSDDIDVALTGSGYSFGLVDCTEVTGVVVQDPAGLMELIHGAIGAARWEERLTWERAYKSVCDDAGFRFPGSDEPIPTYDHGKDHGVALREIRAALVKIGLVAAPTWTWTKSTRESVPLSFDPADAEDEALRQWEESHGTTVADAVWDAGREDG